jgi:hypothetical protein
VEAGFVAVDQSELAVRAGGEFGEGGAEAAGFGSGRPVLEGGIEERFLDGPRTAEETVGDGHLFDDAELGGAGGFEAADKGGGDGFEGFGVFVGEYGAAGEQSVACGVAAGAGFALRGFGTA